MPFPHPFHFIFLLLFLVSCHAEPVHDPNTLVIGLENSPTQLDPRLSTDLASEHISKMVFNGLLKMSPEGNLIPDLAESWEWLDNHTMTLYLKQGIKFHNGKEFDSGDVKFTFDTMMDPAFHSARASSFDVLESIKTPSPTQVVFRLKEPHAPFLHNLTQEIVPKEPTQSSPPSAISQPIGTGPFQFVRYQLDEEVELHANPHYFDGPPKIKTLVFRIIPDETIRILELEKGNLDLLQNAFSPDILPRLKKNPNLKITQRTGTNYSYIGFNLEDPILQNRRVRAAIAHGIHRQRIITTILKGLAVPASGPLSYINWAYNPHLPPYDYNPAQAMKLLDEAGFSDPDGNGPQPRFSLTYKTSQNELRKLIGEILVQQLSEIGIEVKMRSYEWGTFYGDIKSGNFQMFTLTWVGIRDPNFFQDVFHSKNIPPRGANRGRYRNAEIDRLTELGAKAIDSAKRKEIYWEVQKIIASELPYVSLWHSVNVAVMKKNLQGFTIYPDESLASLKNVYFLEVPNAKANR